MSTSSIPAPLLLLLWLLLAATGCACTSEVAPGGAASTGGRATSTGGTSAGGDGAPGGCVHPSVTPDCRDGFCRIEPGCFIMGAPRDEFGAGRYSDIQVQVTLTRAYLIGRTEVTRAEWAAAGWEQPIALSPGEGPSRCLEPECPVANVTFFDVISYANRLSEMRGLPPCYTLSECTGELGNALTCGSVLVNAPTVYDCQGYRLPTEAEWEYAARAGTKTAFYSGDIITRDRDDPDPFGCYPEPNLDDIAWYCNNSDDRAHPVGMKTANGWGLVDILGNVFEYCNDLMDGSGYGEGPFIDPTGRFLEGRELMPERSEPNLRIRRGGGYYSAPINCKTSNRMPATSPDPGFGFRLAQTL